MPSFSLQEIQAATGASPVTGASLPDFFTGVSTDTRHLLPGQLFVPLVGERFDGHDYLDGALAAGATGVLWSRPERPESAPLLAVEDTLEAYQWLGSAYLKRLGVPVVAITGSTGKTTTKDLVAAMLASRYRVHKTEANYNNDIGVPLTLLTMPEDTEVAVLELAMRGPGQIRRLARLLDARVGLITNIGESHIELLGSLEAIADAKGELLECLSPEAVAVLPAGSPFFSRLASKTKAEVRSFSAHPGARATLSPLALENLGIDGWRITLEGGRPFDFSLPGTHHLEDLMAALLAVFELGVKVEDCLAALRSFKPTGLRMEVLNLSGGVKVINDSYNAAPASVEGALEVLCGTPNRRVAVLGDMLELGEHAAEGHQRVGRACARLGVDFLLAVGSQSRALAEAAREGGVDNVVWVASREEAAGVLKSSLQPNDWVL
ncbi:MAG: UDP-N-acetylmuramoyl-tripeptide--D-alanyl-D-alanine ligase, partial [Candidatus Eremiobacteraeota bacterium]|nr:UDP-N-acetylmuramoyl-tripeptide--D-alanyl-D-alanine ligase [Candidatus Eremiobacteraeota bacterium]